MNAADSFVALQHDHGISIPVTIGPLVLRVALLTAAVAVAGFGLLRAFPPGPSPATRRWIALLAPAAVLLELMLASRLDVPDQVAVLLLAVLAVPVRFALTGREAGAMGRLTPWVLGLASAGALAEVGRSVLAGPDPLHTSLVLALTGLAWLTLGLPRSRPAAVVVKAEAVVLATVLVAGMSVGMPW